MTTDPYGAGRPHHPSGLFPAGPPARPTYREPHPVVGTAAALGGVFAAAWLLLFGLLGTGVRAYAWWTMAAGGLAWLAALLLVRYGDRGVGTGIAIVVGGGWSITAAVVASRWMTDGNWPLW